MNRFVLRKADWQNILSYLFFAFLIIWAIITQEERIYISDPAYYFFNIVNNADFFYPGVRYTAIINQFPLVIASRMQLPLDSLLTVYSVSFVLVRLFYFILANNVFKNKAAGYAIIAISFVGVAESYFRPTSESTIALLNSIVLYAWLCYADKKDNWGKLKLPILLSVCLVFIVFGYVSHPISLFSLFFVIVFHALENHRIKSVYPYFSLLFLVIVFSYRIFLGSNGYHHNGIYGNLIHSPFSILTELKNYYPYKFFIHHFKWIYYPYAILFAGALFVAIRKSKWYTALFFVAFTLVYFIVACASFKEGDANMQMEKIFLPNVMFAALVFAAIAKNFSDKYRIGLGGFAILVLGLSMNINIKNYKPRYTRRVNDLHRVVEMADKLDSRKTVITPKQIEHLPLAYCWAYGIETLIISTINEDTKPLTVFIAKSPEEITEKMNQPDNFMPASFQTSFRQQNFNETYFKLPQQEYVLWEEKFGEE